MLSRSSRSHTFSPVDAITGSSAFAIGYLSHVAADVPWHLLGGNLEELGFLLWPVTSMPEYYWIEPIGTIGGTTVTTLWLEAVIVFAGVVLWAYDRAPGCGWLLRRIADW